MNYSVPFWNYPISFSLTFATGILLLWQYPGAKGTVGHVTRWASALFVTVFVVHMNTVTALNQPPMPITNLWQVRFVHTYEHIRSQRRPDGAGRCGIVR